MKKKLIVEKQLGIPASYQYDAINSDNFLHSNWHKNKLKAIELLIKPNKKDRILDLGPGSGNFEVYFGPKVKEIVAIDYNDEAVSFAKNLMKNRKIKNVKLKVGDIKNLDKQKIGKFDTIVMVDVIEHLAIKDVEKMIKSFDKLLKKNGKICIITPNFKSLWTLIELSLDKLKLVPELGGKQHLSNFHKENLIKAFEKQGFKNNHVSTINLFSFLHPDRRIADRLVKLETSIKYPIGNLLVLVSSR